MAEVVAGTAVVGQEGHRVVRCDVFGVLGHEFCTKRERKAWVGE